MHATLKSTRLGLTAILGALFISSTSVAQVDPCRLYKRDEMTGLQSFAKSFAKWGGMQDSAQLQKLDELSPEERMVVGADPILASVADLAYKRAFDISAKYCSDTSMVDGAQDALRHFTLSATLASRVGKKRALELLDAHERGAKVTNVKDLRSTFMDYNNNNLGATFGDSFYPEMKSLKGEEIPPEQITKEFLKLMNGKNIEILEPPRECAGLMDPSKAAQEEVNAPMEQNSMGSLRVQAGQIFNDVPKQNRDELELTKQKQFDDQMKRNMESLFKTKLNQPETKGSH